MHKFCYFIALHFVINSALGNADENCSKCICTGPNGEFATPVADKNVVFDESVSTLTMEEKTLQRLDLIVDTLKVLVKENEKIADSLKVLGKENERNVTVISLLNGIETSIKQVVNNTSAYARNCREATQRTRSSGIYDIQVEKYGSQPFKVYCDEELYGGDWTVVSRRMDGSVDFNRNWTDYKQGFGDLDGEFFIGMDKLYALTNGLYTQELMFVLEDFNYTRKYAKYSAFAIGDESEEYIVKALGDYSGDAGDSFNLHRQQTFKIKDRDNAKNCTRYGAWWYNNCHHSNLFGLYLKGDYDESNFGKGVVWHHWRGTSYSLKFVQMMIRPKKS